MPICTATFKKNGAPCTYKARPGSTECGLHTTTPLCTHRNMNGTHCMRDRARNRLCDYHDKKRQRDERRRQLDEVYQVAIIHIWEHHDIEEARTILMNGFAELNVRNTEGRTFIQRFNDQAEFFQLFHTPVRRRGKPKGELQALSDDRQNVHTSAVSKQTQSGVELLLNTQIPYEQDTLKEIATCWSSKAKQVLKDMKQWYETNTCRKSQDHLYQRLLDGLWTRIKISSEKEELLKRLLEECQESMGMCCEGHISRLCNVLVGFDESFQAPVSVGELLQQKIASIAAEDIDILVKVERAWYVMEELAVPREQREAWIEAL